MSHPDISSKLSLLEKTRDEALLALENLDPTDPEYTKIMEHVKTLSDLVANESSEKLNPNTVVLALANIGGILSIVAYEQKHIFGSAASKLIGKIR